jgi:hypothetical protein
LARDAHGNEREVRFVRRRFVPGVGEHIALAQHVVAPGERLDLIAGRYLGDPTQFWRICDANGVMRPDELEQVGLVIDVSMPKA